MIRIFDNNKSKSESKSRKKNIPVATVIGGGYSKDNDELAERHSIIFDVAMNYLLKLI